MLRLTDGATNWDGVERRSRERFGMIEQFLTVTFNALRQRGIAPDTSGCWEGVYDQHAANPVS